LRDQLKLTDHRKVAQYFDLVKDLNPERKNWDLLVAGQVIRLPVAGRAQETVATKSAVDSNLAAAAKPEPAPSVIVDTKPRGEPVIAPKPAAPIDRRATLRSPARENLALFAKVAETMGSQMQQSGEEVIALNDGAVRFDKKNYPMVFNPVLKQRVVIDPNDTIPASLRTKLSDATIGARRLLERALAGHRRDRVEARTLAREELAGLARELQRGHALPAQQRREVGDGREAEHGHGTNGVGGSTSIASSRARSCVALFSTAARASSASRSGSSIGRSSATSGARIAC